MQQRIQCDNLNQHLGAYKRIFDIVRIVDPQNKKIVNYKNYRLEPDNVPCCSLWSDNKECTSCITKKALFEQDTTIKIQNTDHKMYLMFGIPFEVEGRDLVLELLKDVTDSLIFETVEKGQGHEVRNIIEDINSLLVKDPLTDVYNRRYINQMLPIEINRSVEQNYPLSIAMVDIDCYKKINDGYGHYVGDVAIKAFGKMISRFIRSDVDWVARYGGDEFLVCLHNTDEIEAYKIIERMRKTIEKANIKVDNSTIKITGSFGICTVKAQKMNAQDMIKCADQKLYEAKKQGRNIVIS